MYFYRLNDVILFLEMDAHFSAVLKLYECAQILKDNDTNIEYVSCEECVELLPAELVEEMNCYTGVEIILNQEVMERVDTHKFVFN